MDSSQENILEIKETLKIIDSLLDIKSQLENYIDYRVCKLHTANDINFHSDIYKEISARMTLNASQFPELKTESIDTSKLIFDNIYKLVPRLLGSLPDHPMPKERYSLLEHICYMHILIHSYVKQECIEELPNILSLLQNTKDGPLNILRDTANKRRGAAGKLDEIRTKLFIKKTTLDKDVSKFDNSIEKLNCQVLNNRRKAIKPFFNELQKMIAAKKLDIENSSAADNAAMMAFINHLNHAMDLFQADMLNTTLPVVPLYQTFLERIPKTEYLKNDILLIFGNIDLRDLKTETISKDTEYLGLMWEEFSKRDALLASIKKVEDVESNVTYNYTKYIK